ncbi:MAG: Peptidase M23B [Candidatus Nomurabacteria bacterium GW2011_GWF2_40_31]|uniref:Peptidase M23B n=2 Tax=Candidatus Nomuraibacteriota TaxID=1752729 RepID=A0A837HUL2_9BACT|nr:MAG: Peptidase M23B [Candidatus Nomurabacteria bacterium GW2011_GWD2_39_12]KKR20745.1 MAG: Peptidase M23B [Candidatus Nomurabacteria bacterium GW2011_GWC2_39_41]KKR37327.1 MAG: Peptidase M23B [Candidatus Nomurabacteria bacterium GW2011_GWE2_40_10]KKR38574.1 MAG: Peptidase M23B [Candidatus Nomurabacteria bacterium GW2011_GWB1_40_11]KKR40299.1 MAG: Peptidase M23B [Parcubacteria group bacterium GW2011_GWC1_40_11]KKR59592.1 MAG: Peptidase M23B [Candidatus Nomurabacteria bacterium GW2011_GWF2_40
MMRTLTQIFHSFLGISLLLGSLFLSLSPLPAQAGFFSALIGDDAYAQSDTNTTTQPNKNIQQNSQTLALLQANVSSVSIIQEKNEKSSKKDTLNTDTSVSILSDNALVPATGPMGSSDGDYTPDPDLEETSVYVVRKGDSISAIADMFGVSVNTILAANDMKKGEKLVEGDVLFILPISGLEHTVTKGQTLKNIAKLYKADVNDIAFYNGITPDDKLDVGDKLMIPGGEMFDEGGDKPAPNLNSAPARDRNYYATHPIQNLIGYFVNPAPAGHKTQGLHGPGHRGIDIGAPTGTEIYASASGKVLVVKTGCKVGQKRCGGGYGNMAIVEHPNGTKTLYAHMSRLNTKSGADVMRGQVIGYVGNTGRSTGPHIHFEVFNAKNPGTDWSWAN